MHPPHIIVIAHDIRSTYNVGSLLRTAECLGIKHVYLSGYTPYPLTIQDKRLPYLREKITRQINKTALGAIDLISWSQVEDIEGLIQQLQQQGYTITGLEQAPTSIPLPSWKAPNKIALILGREVEGIAPELLALCDQIIEIPQFGKKESLNVVQAAAIALYQARFAQW